MFILASIPTPDPVLLRDAIFVLQGINGQYLRFDAKTKNYYFVPTVSDFWFGFGRYLDFFSRLSLGSQKRSCSCALLKLDFYMVK